MGSKLFWGYRTRVHPSIRTGPSRSVDTFIGITARAGAAVSETASESAVLASDRSSTSTRDQQRTPLVDAVRQRGDSFQEAPFHVPGHKRGTGTPAAFAQLVQPATGSVLQYDLTEIAGLDFLSSPSGVIREAQQLAAAAFGADDSWFLVNGCSVGIHAAVVAVTTAATAAASTARTHPAAAAAASERESRRDAAAAPAAAEGTVYCEDPGSGPIGCGGGGNEEGRKTAAVGGAPLLVVARNCHLSAFSAMVVAGCEPYWVQPEVDPRFGVAHCVTRGSVRAALEAAAASGRTVAGVMIVSPTYFGAVADVAGIAEECHLYGVPLLVDEAHGGHFAFLPSGPIAAASTAAATASTTAAAAAAATAAAPPPPSALSCGADAVIQSTHKVLGAMTQAAMLHVRGPRVCRTRIGRALQTLQSSSPSYILMASLDAARAQAAAGGAFDEPLAAAQLIRAAVSQCRTIEILDKRTAGARHSVLCFDPLRLTLLVEGVGLPGGGFGAAEWLERRHGVVPELATAKTVVLALGPGSILAHARIAAAAIQELDREACRGASEPRGAELGPGGGAGDAAGAVAAAAAAAAAAAVGRSEGDVCQPDAAVQAAVGEAAVEVVMTPREAFFEPVTSVSADEAVGRVSAELLCPYPPGVPVLFPGERITAAALTALRATLHAGGVVTGATDGSLGSLAVVVV